MRKLPSLSREIRRVEDEPGYEKEAWRPTWTCFCCHDFAVVRPHLARMVIRDYNPDKDKLPFCQNPACQSNLGQTLMESDNVDMRFDSETCAELDEIEREVWREWEKEHHELRKKAKELTNQFAQSTNLRPIDRTSAEEYYADRNNKDVLADLEREKKKP